MAKRPKDIARLRRKRRIHAVLRGTAARPRLVVYRSNKYQYAQVVDDASGKVLTAMNDLMLKNVKGSKKDRAEKIGEKIAELAKEKGVSNLVFDRNGYRYHGRIKAIAEAVRKEGLLV